MTEHSDGECEHNSLRHGDRSDYLGDGVWVMLALCKDCDTSVTVKKETEVIIDE